MPNKSKTAKGGKKVVKAWGIFSCATDGLMEVYLTKLEAKAEKMCDYIRPVEISYSLTAKKE